MEAYLRGLIVDGASSFYRINHYRVGEFFGPVDLGLFLAGRSRNR